MQPQQETVTKPNTYGGYHPSRNVQRFTAKKKKAFIASMGKTGNVTVSCLTVGISRRWAYKHRDMDPVFAQSWDDAYKASTDLLIEECRRRAYNGVDEPVFYKGEVCGQIRKYSDTLLMFKIQAERPEYNRSRMDIQVSGPGGGPILLGPALDARLQELLARNRQVGLPAPEVVDVPPDDESETG